jgi:hypothetical protein
MRDSTALPDLQMLPSEALVPHEDVDPRRTERLSQRIRQEGILKNPPVVAPIPDSEKYVVLDGANRAMAFIKLGIPHIVAQLVDYNLPGLILDTWYHVISGMLLADFEQAITTITGAQLENCSLEAARQALESGEACSYIVCASGVRKLTRPKSIPTGDLHILGELVNAYKGRADIFRASNDVWELQAPYYPNITALVIFPRYRPQDILEAARNGYKVPTGITRHVIPHRALNINIPLEVLAADWGIEPKRQWLHDWLMDRMANNAIRYYAEPTFSFNE